MLALLNPGRTEFNWRRVNKRRPCPVCGRRDWCEVSDDGRVVHCLRTPGDKAVEWRGGGWLHFLWSEPNPLAPFPNKEGGTIPPQPPTLNPSLSHPSHEDAGSGDHAPTQHSALSSHPSSFILHPSPTSLAPPEIRAVAIGWLLDRLTLEEEHRQYLAGEQMQVLGWELGYRSLPGDGEQRRELLDGLRLEFGSEIARSLGFCYERLSKSVRPYLEFAGVLRGVAALLIPIRDKDGRTLALKARSIDPQSGERYYRVMSAGNTERGAGVGVPIHVARPRISPPGLENWAIITEGEKKADFVAHNLGLVCLGVQGVGNWRAGGLVPLLRELGIQKVVEAFDADRVLLTRGKDNIEKQARRLSEQCAAAGLQVFTARWSLEEGKGLDDFLRQQPELHWPKLSHFKPENTSEETLNPTLEAEFKRRYGLSRERAGRVARQFVELEADTLAALQKPDPKEVSLAEARQKLPQYLGAAIDRHILSQGQNPSRILFRTTTGTGKSYAAAQQIKLHLAFGRPGRYIILTDTKQNYAELFGPGGWLESEYRAGEIAVREGRSPEAGPYYCKRYAECRELGERRHPASADICSTCPFGSAANWQKYAPEQGYDPAEPRPFACEKNGYLASVKRAKNAAVVVAPKAALLNASHELAEFDFIILDEDCTDFLLEKQSLGAEQIREWREGQTRLEEQARLRDSWGAVVEYVDGPNDTETEVIIAAISNGGDMSPEPEVQKSFGELRLEHAPFLALFELVQATLTEFEAATNKAGRAPLLPLLRARAEAEGLDLGWIIGECEAIRPGRKFRRYQWERPYREAQRLKVPLRFACDLVEQLSDELETAEGGDTRLWLTRDGAGLATIAAYLPRQNLLDILNGKTNHYPNQFGQAPTLFLLDATAGPELKLALPGLEEIEIQVPQPLYVIQTTDSLFTKTSLENGKRLDKISRAIATVARRVGATRPVVFSRKAFNPDFAEAGQPTLQVGLPGVRYGHFERHNRGLNDYQDADLLAVVGHYSQPIEEIEARVMAFRGRKTRLNQAEQNPAYRLRPYNWQGRDNRDMSLGLARWCRSHPDPEVQAAIDHSSRANLLQAIGRGRPALRAKPLVVLLFCSLPLEGLRVDELTGLADILEESRITEAQRAALDAGRDKINRERAAEALARIEQAKAELQQSGEKIMPPGRFAKYAGVSRSTLGRLGYGRQGRWVTIGDVREGFSQEMFISLKIAPVKPKLE